MRAAVLELAGQALAVVDDVEVEDPGVGEVAVAVAHCGICHSDLSLIDGAMPSLIPIVLGHEAAGVVTAVGPGVTTLREGDHVVLTPCPPCGSCYFCIRGEWSICLNSRSLMTSAHPDGGTRLSRAGQVVYRGLGVAAFAETVITEANGAVKVPDDVPLDVACVLGCAVQTGVGAVLNTAKVQEGDSMLVMGLGGVGLSVVQGARLAAASTVIVSDPVAERRELAMKLGATHAIDPTTDDVVSACLDLTEHGVDFAFDAVGSNALIETGINATRFGGSTVLVGVAPLGDPLHYPSATIVAAMAKNILGCLLGSANSLREIPRLIDLWRGGHLDLESLITGHRPLDDINAAVDDLRASRGVRTVIDL